MTQEADLHGRFKAWLASYVGEQDPEKMRFSTNELEQAFTQGALLPPAGMEALPADLPDSAIEEGDGAIPYTLQQFNALVSANTALQAESVARDELVAELRATIANQARDLGTAAGDWREERTAHAKTRDELTAVREQLAGEQIETAYQRDRAEALQRKLDRSSGWIDRVLDQEAGYDKPETIAAPKPPIGPDLDAIPMPHRRSMTMSDGDAMFSGYARLAPDERFERRRRY